jgi:hypothetical protein
MARFSKGKRAVRSHSRCDGPKREAARRKAEPSEPLKPKRLEVLSRPVL